MALRTVKCTLVNDSKHNLQLVSVDLPHGEWSGSVQPPKSVPFGTSASWGSESFGIFTGTEGSATYWVGATGCTLKVYWNNPFAGSNTFTQTLIPPASPTDGPGFPEYQTFDPMRPDLVKTPAEPKQFESGSDIAIEYRVIQTEAVATSTAAPPANPPAAGDPRVASAPPEKPTTVKCPAGFRKVLFFSLSPTSAYHEVKQIRAQVKPEDLTVITNTTHKWVNDDTEFEKRTPKLNSVRPKLKTLEAADDLMEFTGPGYSNDSPLTVDSKLRIYTIRALAVELAEYDDDLSPGNDCLGLRRLCISSHHARSWTHRRDDFFWGSNSHNGAPVVVLTAFKDDKVNGILAGLAEIFPKAFARVEDLCFSACYTAWYWAEDDQSGIPAAMFRMFKNLSTLWAYKNGSPGAVNYVGGKDPPPTSSNLAIIKWEAASRDADSADEIEKASLEIRKKLGAGLKTMGQSIIYDKGKRRPAPDPGQPQVPSSCAQPGGAPATI